MRKSKYMNLYKKEKDIDLTDEDIREWLDRIVINHVKAWKNEYDLCWGTFKNGEYSNEISICRDSIVKIHIYRGIERLAKAVGEKLQYRYREGEGKYPHEYYFNYKEAYVFEIREEK